MTRTPPQPDDTLKPPQRGRKRQHALLAVVTLGALATCVVMLNLLAERWPARIDVTATGQQELSPRTQRLLSNLPGPTRVVVATDLSNADPRALRNLRDVLDELKAAQPLLTPTLVDTATPAGLARYRSLVSELRAREQPALDANAKAIDEAGQAMQRVSTLLRERVARGLEEAAASAELDAPGEAAPARLALRGTLQQIASLCRVRANEVSETLARVKDAMSPQDAEAIPATDQAAQLLSTRGREAGDDLAALARELGATAQRETTPRGVREVVAPLLGQLESSAEQLRQLPAGLLTLPRPNIVRVTRALAGGEGALLIGEGAGAGQPATLVALDLQQLLPASAWLNQAELAQRDLRGRTEELLSTSLAGLLSPVRPVVVLVHPDPQPYLVDKPFFASLDERLANKGIDFIEWQVGLTPSPDVSKVDPTGARPRVYVSLAPETLKDFGGQTGAQRARTLGQALSELVERGESILVNLQPSMLAFGGGKDPLVEALAPLGIGANTAAPVFREIATPQGPGVDSQLVAQATGDHIIGTAVGSLPTVVSWTVPLVIAPRDGVTSAAVLRLPTDIAAWGETQWVSVRDLRRDQLAFALDRPKFDASRDVRVPSGGWVVAAAAERSHAGRTQRVVVVGSNVWFADGLTQQTVSVEGRPVLQYPGNLELFDASVAWLAGEDEQIAQSPTARSVAMVRAMDAGRLFWLRTGLIAGPATCALLAGVLVWLLRRR